jgi:hypothetical protein
MRRVLLVLLLLWASGVGAAPITRIVFNTEPREGFQYSGGTKVVITADSGITMVMAAGSRLVFKSVKAGNAEKNAGVTITYTVR